MSNHTSQAQDTPRWSWLWLPVWLLAASLAIFQHGPIPVFSTHTLSVAWEMWHQHSFLVPHLNGAPYGEKSPLLYWLIHLGWAVGGVSDVWPRLLAVLIGATVLWLALTLARRLFPRHSGAAHAVPWVLMAFSYGFLFSLQIMYDVLLAACVLAAFIAIVPIAERDRPRFGWFALALGLGLLAKGPVMLLHTAMPWLLGPLWNDWARAHKRRWYGHGALALLLGGLMLGAWAIPAMWQGGAAYRNLLLFHQTGRLVNAFAHAKPFWWYLPVLLLLIFPFTLWPRLWLALTRLPRTDQSGLRFLGVWLVPVVLVFSAISGKQPYYLFPEFAGLAMLMAVALQPLPESADRLSRSYWLSPWPLGLLFAGLGGLLVALPHLVEGAWSSNHWLLAMAPSSVPFGVVYLALGVFLLLPGRNELHRVAFAGLTGTAAASLLFGMSAWQAFNLSPAATVLGHAQAQAHPVASYGMDANDFLFLGRLRQPVRRLHGVDDLERWATAHPDGLIVTFPPVPAQGPIYQQRFRGVWLDIWRASACTDQPYRCAPGRHAARAH